MRIVSGIAGGIPLIVPPGPARPTTDRVRESLFASLGDALEGARVLDLFAGSGSLGLECLSRGAAEALFVDRDRRAGEAIRTNLAKTRLEGGLFRRGDIFAFLRGDAEKLKPWDFIFADPPYARGKASEDLIARLLGNEVLPRLLVPGHGRFLLESASRVPLPLPESPRWEVQREKTYGETRITHLVPA